MSIDKDLLRHIRKESITNGIMNTLFNGVIAWLLLRSQETLPLWGEHSFGVDLIATAFLLLLIISLIVIPFHKRKVHKGTMPPLCWDESRIVDRILRSLPANTVLGGLAFGFFGLIVVSPLTIVPLYALGITQLDPLGYALFKGVWAGLLAAVMVGPMIRFGLGYAEVQAS